jgi:hypothetical protein
MLLVVGFLALCGSEFVPTIYFGCLVRLAMLGGLLGNLVVLPLLLRVVSRDNPDPPDDTVTPTGAATAASQTG